MTSPTQRSIKDRLLNLSHEDELAKSDALKMYGLFPLAFLLFAPLVLLLLFWAKSKVLTHQNTIFVDHFVQFCRTVWYCIVIWVISFFVVILFNFVGQFGIALLYG